MKFWTDTIKELVTLTFMKFIEQQVQIVSDLVFGNKQDTTLSKGGIKGNPQVKSQLRRNSFVTHVSLTDEHKAGVHEK